MTKEQKDKLIEAKRALASLNTEAEELRQKVDNATEDELKEINRRSEAIRTKRGLLEDEIASLVGLDEPQTIVSQRGLTDTPRDASFEEFRTSKAYENAWVKAIRGNKNISEEEQRAFIAVNGEKGVKKLRALGVAITSTAEEFIAATAEVDGQNNGGVWIPTSVSDMIVNRLKATESPFYQDTMKINILGNVNFPYEKAMSDAKWYEEGTCTEDETAQWGVLKLGGYELAKFHRITWKLRAMTNDSFVAYIVNEVVRKMHRKEQRTVIYGTGNKEPRGATYSTGTDASASKKTYGTGGDFTNMLAAMEKAPAELEALQGDNTDGSKDDAILNALVDAKYYLSRTAYNALLFSKDAQNRYQFNPQAPVLMFGAYPVKIDPYLKSGEIIFGDGANYIWNRQAGISVATDSDVKCRRDSIGAYGVMDGTGIPGSFVHIVPYVEPTP